MAVRAYDRLSVHRLNRSLSLLGHDGGRSRPTEVSLRDWKILTRAKSSQYIHPPLTARRLCRLDAAFTRIHVCMSFQHYSPLPLPPAFLLSRPQYSAVHEYPEPNASFLSVTNVRTYVYLNVICWPRRHENWGPFEVYQTTTPYFGRR